MDGRASSGPTAIEQPGFLSGVRVLELADELGEYCGKLLAGLGADVIKIEAPSGEKTRHYGPFYHDVEDINRSLYFWHYNFGKKGIVVDLDTPAGVETFRSLAKGADVVLDTRQRDYLPSRELGYDGLRQLNPGLIYARISPFGDTGPWSDFVGSDLVHLALGGVVMNCGYDPDPTGSYDTQPIAPQMWHAYHIAGEMSVMAIIAALIYRMNSGVGQTISTSVHEAVSGNSEIDVPNWIFLRQEHYRLTCTHSQPTIDPNLPLSIAMTKDGRWIRSGVEFEKTLRILKKWGMQQDLDDERYQSTEYRSTPEARAHIGNAVKTLVGKFKYDHEIWQEAQAEGMAWAPLALPEENVNHPHWRTRGAYIDVTHQELNETFEYVGSKWYCSDIPWGAKSRAPMLGEHTSVILDELSVSASALAKVGAQSVQSGSAPDETPWALNGLRVLDLSWMLATAGAGRYLAAFGADVLRVEHESHWDHMRWVVSGIVPSGGREERERATSPIPTPDRNGDPNLGGSFMEINAGKRGFSLNLRHARGKELLTKLIEQSDVIVEGFSNGALERMGFGYDRLKELNPEIVYVSQSGLGEFGDQTGTSRTNGPTAAGFAGLSEMSGLPQPYPPAGIGYSYLDWFGAYNMANAVLAAVYRQRATGLGAHVDASQVEVGTYLTGTAVLDRSVNGRRWQRYGNRSPFKRAAPHGVYQVQGDDRWIAIACFADDQWNGLLDVINDDSLAEDARFMSLDARLAHQDELDEAVNQATQSRDPFELMLALQHAGVPAGVCQTAQDRCETDPQLAHLKWMVELPQTRIGTWPVKAVPMQLSLTPPRIGGLIGRSGPNYGEDNDYVLREMLHLTSMEIVGLADDGVF